MYKKYKRYIATTPNFDWKKFETIFMKDIGWITIFGLRRQKQKLKFKMEETFNKVIAC